MTPERAKRRKSRIKWTVVGLIAVVALAGVALGAYLYFHSLQQEELRNSLIANCERNGNPLREVLQHRIQREIKQNSNQKLLEKILPDTDPTELEHLVRRTVKILKAEEEEVGPVNCTEQYTTK